MRYPKRPLTFDEQVDLLVSRGLIIGDRTRAFRWLERISYYRLSAYFLPFKVRNTDTYRTGATFDAVIELYKFDARLRILILQAIERIEVAARTSIVYEMSHAHGTFSYANAANFSPTFNHIKLMEDISKEESRSREEFVAHFRTKYHSEPYLPLWMVTELLSLGATSMMYKGLRHALQKQIAHHFHVPEGSFKTWLHTLNYVRNACAHHNRLWNRTLAIAPAFPRGFQHVVPANNKLYAVLVMMQFMLDAIAPRCRWKDRVMNLILDHEDVPVSLMGFPPRWKSLSPWSMSQL